jgi:hypothetical protein
MIKLILLTALFSQLSFATAAAPDLFHYTVYTKDGIDADCGDYLGNVASGGDINLSRFLIHSTDSNKEQGSCVIALDSAKTVNYHTGRLEDRDHNEACIGASLVLINGYEFPRVNTNLLVDWDKPVATVAPIADLNQQLDTLSQTLLSHLTYPSIHQVSGTLASLRSQSADKIISLSGSANALLVLNVLDRNVDFEGYGIKLSGGLQAENIVWNFPNATEIVIANSGTTAQSAHYGIPGTFVAPYANVTFHNALITGALFAKRISSTVAKTSESLSCKGAHAGQVNPTCLSSPIPGIGCQKPTPGTPTTPTTPTTPGTPVKPGAPSSPPQQQQQQPTTSPGGTVQQQQQQPIPIITKN